MRRHARCSPTLSTAARIPYSTFSVPLCSIGTHIGTLALTFRTSADELLQCSLLRWKTLPGAPEINAVEP